MLPAAFCPRVEICEDSSTFSLFQRQKQQLEHSVVNFIDHYFCWIGWHEASVSDCWWTRCFTAVAVVSSWYTFTCFLKRVPLLHRMALHVHCKNHCTTQILSQDWIRTCSHPVWSVQALSSSVSNVTHSPGAGGSVGIRVGQIILLSRWLFSGSPSLLEETGQLIKNEVKI